MASFAVGGSGATVELPPVRVAIVRDQGESTLAPSNDIVPFLEARGRERWDIQTFDERDFGGALGAAGEFDVIVLGYNATAFAPALREALREAPPTAPVLMLHQREQDCFEFLGEELAIDLVKLGDGVAEAVIPRERQPAYEPVLNWPHADLTVDGRLRAKAIRGLSFSRDGAWRVVLEAQRGAQRLPVLIRTRTDHRQRIVACSLLLRPAAEAAHGDLLENLLVYCAFGWPDVALVELEGDATAVQRIRGFEQGMAMWAGGSVRVVIPATEPLPIDRWPLRGVKRIVAPAELSWDAQASGWMRRGGELIRVAADGGVVVTAQLTDRFVLLRQWAVWFAALPEPQWLARLSTARSVLRVLAAVEEDPALLEDVRFEVEPAAYAREVAALVADRLRGDNVDETISTTAAALDLDALTGKRALSGLRRRRVEAWLQEQLDGATRSDQLDILRALGDQELLRGRLEQWRDDWPAEHADRRIDALVATRLREAVHACWPAGGEPEGLLSDATLAALDDDLVVGELRHSPLLCAEFLAAFYARNDASPLFDVGHFPRSLAVAVDHVSARGLFTETPDVRAVCSHSLAMFRHLERHPAGLRFLAERGELPQSAAESVLQEATRARGSEREARRDLPALGIAVLVLASIALGLEAIALLGLWRLTGIEVSVRPWWLPLALLAITVGVLATLRWFVLVRTERVERRDLRLAQNVVASLALGIALVVATLAWRVGAPNGGVTALALVLGPLVGSTAFAALLVLLRRLGLAPQWSMRVLGLSGDIKSPLAALTKLLGDPPRQ